MAKVTIKGIPKLKENVKKLFEETRSDAQMLIEIGEKTVELTKAFNRAGKSPDGKAHKKLSKSWIDRKEKLTKTNKVSDFYISGFSNLTFTGQLLDSIKLKKINQSEGSVIINATGPRKPYNNLNGKSVGTKNTPTNEKLVEYLRDMKRFVFGINKQIENNINRIVRKYLNKRIKETFRKK